MRNFFILLTALQRILSALDRFSDTHSFLVCKVAFICDRMNFMACTGMSKVARARGGVMSVFSPPCSHELRASFPPPMLQLPRWPCPNPPQPLLFCQPLFHFQHPFWSYFFFNEFCSRWRIRFSSCWRAAISTFTSSFMSPTNWVQFIGETVFHFKHSICDFISHHGAQCFNSGCTHFNLWDRLTAFRN